MSARMTGPSPVVLIGAAMGGSTGMAVAWWQAMPAQIAAGLAFILLCLGALAAAKFVR